MEVLEAYDVATETRAGQRRLRREIDEAEDSLRIYRLAGPRVRYVKDYGALPPHGFREPLIV